MKAKHSFLRTACKCTLAGICVGITTALQFGPQLLLLPWTGIAADRYNQRKLLMATQAAMGLLALGLGLLTLTGAVTLWGLFPEACIRAN